MDPKPSPRPLLGWVRLRRSPGSACARPWCHPWHRRACLPEGQLCRRPCTQVSVCAPPQGAQQACGGSAAGVLVICSAEAAAPGPEHTQVSRKGLGDAVPLPEPPGLVALPRGQALPPADGVRIPPGHDGPARVPPGAEPPAPTPPGEQHIARGHQSCRVKPRKHACPASEDGDRHVKCPRLSSGERLV